jgi:hypothetical protein
MKRQRLLPKILLLACVGALTTSSAFAALVTWELNPANLNEAAGSSSINFNVSGFSITARGYDHPSSGPDVARELFYRYDGPGGVHGLGLVGTLDHELQVNDNGSVANYIQLDLRSILAQGFTAGQVQVGSLQLGNSFRFFGSNSVGVLGTQLPGIFDEAFDEQFVSIPNFGSFQFISIASNEKDVLPMGFRALMPVPEMNALFPIIGLIAAVSCTQVLRRRRAALLLTRNAALAS